MIGRLKQLGLIDAALRAPQAGAPLAWVTTRKFLQVFGLSMLRDLPDIEKLEDEGLLQRPVPAGDLDRVFCLPDGDAAELEDIEFDDAADDA